MRAIAEDRDGGLWLGGLAGLRYMRGSEIVTYDQKQGLSSNSVYDVHQDSTGTLWVATYGGGLNRFRDWRTARAISGLAPIRVYFGSL